MDRNEAAVREGLKGTDALDLVEASLKEMRRPVQRLAFWATLKKYGPGGLMERTDQWADVAEGVHAAVLLDTPNDALIGGCVRKARERRLAREVTRTQMNSPRASHGPSDAFCAQLDAEVEALRNAP